MRLFRKKRPITEVPCDDGKSKFLTPSMWVSLCLYCCCFLFFTLFFLGAFWYQATRKSRSSKLKDQIQNRPPFAAPIKYIEPPSPNHLCNSYYRRMANVYPPNQDGINSTKNVECELIFFGYVSNGILRYLTHSKEKPWIMLRMSPDGSLPFNFQDCYEIGFPEYGTPTVVSTNDCASSAARKRLLFVTKDNEACDHRQFKCIEIFKSKPFDNRQLKRILSLGHVRSSRKGPKMSEPGSIIAMAIKNKFEFKHRDKSSRFSVIDPEYDCVAYDVLRNRVVTRDCDDEGCPFCVIPV